MSEAKILLVEDNEFSRDMLSHRLRKRGFEVVVACNGFEAIQQSLTQHPSLILMDLSLPMMDGWNATKQIKYRPEINRIPVIALTAHAMNGDREKALEAGCDDYITKPVKLDELLSLIDNWLPQNNFL